MTETPIYDTVKPLFDEVRQLAHQRGRLEAQLEILNIIRQIKRPTSQIKDLIEMLSNADK